MNVLGRWVAGAMLVGCSAAAWAQAGPYAVLDKWIVGGEGGWDYAAVDPSAHLLYVTHGTRVEVLNTTTGKAVGAVTELKSTHGLVFDDAGKLGYISEGAGNAVVVFDRKTFAIVNRIPAGTNPDGLLWEPVTKTVWAFNGRSMDATVIDTAAMKVVATIKLSGKPEFPAADGKGSVFVNIETKNTLVKLDAKTWKQTAEWPLTGCESPTGLAIDEAHERLFSVCDGGKMAITDGASGKVLGLASVGEGPDAASFDAKNQVAFSSNGESGTLSVVSNGAGFKTIQTVPTQKSGRTMAFDPSTGRVYVVVAEMGPKPAATAAAPRPRASAKPGTFAVVVVGRR